MEPIPVFGRDAHIIDTEAAVACDTSQIASLYAKHTHTYYEIFVVVSGTALHLINDSVQVVRKGDLCCIRPRDVHCYNFYQSADFQIYNLSFLPELYQLVAAFLGNHSALRDVEEETFPLCVSLDDEALRHYMRSFERIDQVLQDGQKSYARTLGQCLLAFVLANYVLPATVTQDAHIPKWLTQLVTMMRQKDNFVGGYSRMKELAPCSPNHLSRMFQLYYGQTPSRFIATVRLRYALYLLRQTELPILSVCAACGFTNVSHFYHLFHQTFGTSPAKIRSSGD